MRQHCLLVNGRPVLPLPCTMGDTAYICVPTYCVRRPLRRLLRLVLVIRRCRAAVLLLHSQHLGHKCMHGRA